MAGVKGKSGGARPNSGGPRKNSGGARPGAGRKPAKKQPPKTPEQGAEAAAAKAHMDALDYLTAVINDVSQSPRDRIRAAIGLAQYTHVKKGEGGKKDAKKDAALAAAGKFASAPAPPRLAAVGGKPV